MKNCLCLFVVMCKSCINFVRIGVASGICETTIFIIRTEFLPNLDIPKANIHIPLMLIYTKLTTRPRVLFSVSIISVDICQYS